VPVSAAAAGLTQNLQRYVSHLLLIDQMLAYFNAYNSFSECCAVVLCSSRTTVGNITLVHG